MKKKIVSLVLVFALALALGIGGTVAWLTATSETVTNTFTVGNIDLELKEHKLGDDGVTLGTEETSTNTYDVVPGWIYGKDPYVTITEGSEACWLFVKIEKSTDFDNYITYAIADGWTEGNGSNGAPTGYIFKEIANPSADPIYILEDNQITVKNTVTKDMADEIENGTKEAPQMKFSAAAVQLYKTNNQKMSATEAWAALPEEFTGTAPTNP